MTNENSVEGRLLKNEFVELIRHLPAKDIFFIEYRIGLIWHKLFSYKHIPVKQYSCKLCVVDMSSFNNLLFHIDGRRHKLQIERVVELFHPDYTYPKIWNLRSKKYEITTHAANNKDNNYQEVECHRDGTNISSSLFIKTQFGSLIQQKTLIGENEVDVAVSNEKADISKISSSNYILENISDKIVSVSKNTNLVVNPAASSSHMSKTHCLKHSQYQTDQIIMPTVTKNKISTEVICSSTHKSEPLQFSSVLPSFYTKAYSCNPKEIDVRGILGVEYVIKILKNSSDISPRYECGLCELVLDSFAMQRHLEGYNHRLQFCEKHFPTAIRHYRQYIQDVPEHETFKVMTPVLSKLAIAIEQYHGRNLPYECYDRDFSLNRHQILAKAFSCRHASEHYGPTFTHVIDSKEMVRFINDRYKYGTTSVSHSAIFDSKPGKMNMVSRNIGENSVQDATVRDHHLSLFSISPADSCDPTAGPDDTTYKLMIDDVFFLNCGRRKRVGTSLQTTSLSKRRTISPKHKCAISLSSKQKVDKQIFELRKRFLEYQHDPESYPAYSEEWQTFWKRRKHELIIAGLDHRQYNYQPEWIRFIKDRIDALFSLEVENITKKTGECMAMSNDDFDIKYHAHSPKIITDMPTIYTSETTMLVAKSHVVSVLRLMTAFEEHLGNLGPKITKLLSKALHVDKIDRKLFNDTILNDENVILIEKVKETFKGLIYSKVLKGPKERAVQNIVEEVDALLLSSHHRTCNSSGNQNKRYSQHSSFCATADICTTPKTQSYKKYLGFTSNDDHIVEKELTDKLFPCLVEAGKNNADQQLIEKNKLESLTITNPSSKYISTKSKTLSDTLSELIRSTFTSAIENVESISLSNQ